MQIIRSYQKFINELINLKKPFRIEIIGHVVYEKNIYPVIAVRHIVKTAKKNIIITSGNHGEEYYTIYIPRR